MTTGNNEIIENNEIEAEIISENKDVKIDIEDKVEAETEVTFGAKTEAVFETEAIAEDKAEQKIRADRRAETSRRTAKAEKDRKKAKREAKRKAKSPKELKRKEIIVRNSVVSKLKATLRDIAEDIELDTDKIESRIEISLRSEYGPIAGLVNMLSAIANWPIDSGTSAETINEKRKVLENRFKLDLILLDDIRGMSGYHSFVTDEVAILKGVEPDYENYELLVTIFIEQLFGIELNDSMTVSKVNSITWNRKEKSAVEKAEIEKDSRLAQLEIFKAKMEQKALLENGNSTK